MWNTDWKYVHLHHSFTCFLFLFSNSLIFFSSIRDYLHQSMVHLHQSTCVRCWCPPSFRYRHHEPPWVLLSTFFSLYIEHIRIDNSYESYKISNSYKSYGLTILMEQTKTKKIIGDNATLLMAAEERKLAGNKKELVEEKLGRSHG